MTKTRDLVNSVNVNSIPGGRLQDSSVSGVKIDPNSPVEASDVNYDPNLPGSVDRSADEKLGDLVSVKDFGAVGDGAEDDTNAINAALASGAAVVHLLDKHFITNTISVPNGVAVVCDNVSVVTADFSELPPPTNNFNRVPAFTLAGSNFIRNVRVSTVVANRTDSRNGANMDPLVDGFSLIGSGSGNVLENASAEHCWIAFKGGGSDIKMTNCGSSDTRFASINYYNATDIQVVGGSFLNCGGFGGLTFPSCKKIRVEGTYVTNLESTGINPGGSSTPGFNAEDVTIVNNVVYAREAINPENGVEGCTITGNIVYFGSSSPSEGSGIGVSTHTGGGPIKDVSISGNTVRIIPGAVGASLPLVVGPTNAFLAENITITGNVTTGNVGIFARGACKNLVISDNVVNGNTWGVRVGNATNLTLANNFFSTLATITISNYYGISLDGIITNGLITGNTTKGFGVHYLQQQNCANTSIFDCTYVRNEDNAGFTKISYSGGVTDKLSVEPRIRQTIESGSSPSITVNESIRCGLALLRGNVNGAPESNESVSLWLVMNSKNGASTGYTVEGISVVKIADLKHDFASAIANCSLSGSTTTNTLTVTPGGFNTFVLSFIPLT